MSDSALLLLILFLLLCLVLTVGGLLVYSGLLTEVVIKTGAPPIRNVTVAYKFKQGAYKDSGAAFTETYSIGPKLRAIGIFYDDPKKERKLCAFPFVETFHSDFINYMVPLCRQMDFFVPELTEQVKTDGKDEDSDEDRGTDITGADSHSDVSSVSGGVPWDSRETSLAASTAASLASSLPLRDIMDSNEDNKHREHSDRGSNDSVGSGSSFEELDMDQEELEEGDGMEGEKEKGTPEEEDDDEGEKEGAEEEAGLVAKRKFLGDGEE
uniref:Testis expressed 264, ER-phagy receptor a n=1 Tax=Xiphophorus maculatus TaxID=8083 RepID=A0A3B5QHE6_XIPMA